MWEEKRISKKKKTHTQRDKKAQNNRNCHQKKKHKNNK